MRPQYLLAPALLAGTALAQCNGNAALCDRLWSDVALVGTHDSAFVGVLPTDNQDMSITDQLNAGIRFIQAQTHYFLNTLTLCHTSCWEKDAGPVVNYLTDVRNWLDANPNEVITMLLTNGDRVDVSDFGDVMSASGLDKYAFTPSGHLAIGDWPTLQEMINAGTRLVFFLDYEANTATVPYILDEFSYFFETAFDVTDPKFSSCALDRPGGSNGDGLMMIINHFLDLDILGIDIPDNGADTTTNAATGTGSIGAQSDLCFATWGRRPNLVLVDFFEHGDVFTAQDTLNGL